uniref:Secreted protein n=1 Tax=Micrurus paraensis TaxID=1970185 RepID=A0A2D4KAF1_9SAUR
MHDGIEGTFIIFFSLFASSASCSAMQCMATSSPTTSHRRFLGLHLYCINVNGAAPQCLELHYHIFRLSPGGTKATVNHSIHTHKKNLVKGKDTTIGMSENKSNCLGVNS